VSARVGIGREQPLAALARRPTKRGERRLDRGGNLHERDTTFQKEGHGLLVRRIENGWCRSACTTGIGPEAQRRELIVTYWLERQR